MSESINRYVEGGLLAVLGLFVLLWGLPSLATIPKIGRNTPKKKAFWILMRHLHFFVCCVLIGASVGIRVIIYHFGADFSIAYLIALIPCGVGVALISVLFYRLLMLGAGVLVGMIIGGIIEAGLSNLTEMRDEHEWGKLLMLTCGLCVGFLMLKTAANSALPRFIYALAGAPLLVMSVNCFDVLPSSVRLKSILPHVRFIPEIADTECAELALDQSDVYKFAAVSGACIAIPVFLFVIIPWVHRKIHCAVFSADGCGLRIQFKPHVAPHETQGLMGALKQHRKEKRERKKKEKEDAKRKGETKSEESISDETADESESYKKRSSVSSSHSVLSTSSGRYIERAKVQMKKEDERIEILNNKFEMFNKQREKMLNGDDEEEENKPPPGMLDWRRGSPDKVVPAVKILATRLVHFFIMGWGLFWLIWLLGWGRNWSNFIAVISWFGFAIAEIVNYFLGLIYNFNFWTASVRKRKSLYNMTGFLDSVKEVRVDTCIFHYKEDPNTTQKTLQGCLMLKRTPNVRVTHRICDDSFGQKRSDSIRQQLLKEKEEKGENFGRRAAQRTKTVLEWIKEKGKWCMGGRCNCLPCSFKCCKKHHRRGKKNKKDMDKQKKKEGDDVEMHKIDGADGDLSSDEEDEDEFGDNYIDDTISQADIDNYPFPEFDALFYPLPEAFKKDLEQKKAKNFSTDSEKSGDEKRMKKVGKLGWDYRPDSKGKEVDGDCDDERTGEEDEEDPETAKIKKILCEPIDDRIRKIYEKNRRILRHLALGKDEYGDNYDFEPSLIGKEIVMRVMETLELYLEGPVVPVLHLKEEMFREDCSRGSLCLTFELKYPNKQQKGRHGQSNIKIITDDDTDKEKIEEIEDEDHYSQPEKKDKVKIVVRIKPQVHHNKAGNINNVLYNTELFKKGDFLAFFDNDMRPEPDFLIYTLPWFFTEVEEKRYAHYDNVSFVQTPQIFIDKSIADGDKLCNANGIFFNAIQPGRDGENACAFAGTNAVFSKRALLRIGGIPYESQTEDAHTSIRLHRDGFVSYYINLPLVIGEAPMTVASRLLQFLRWVKGSIQLWWAQFYKPPKKCMIGKAPPKLSKEERPAGVLLNLFAIDTMTWPLSAISALIYMFCALVFVYFGEPPIKPHDPFNSASFLWIFLPYFCFRMLNNWIALQGVKSSSIWVAQEVWLLSSVHRLLGILDALYEKFMGKGITGWRATGEGCRTSRIEYFNIIILILLVFGIIVRFIIFLAVPDDRLLAVGSAFFAAVILVQLWPMVSMSLYELLINEYRPSEEKKELGRFKIPNWLLFTGILIAGISVGVIVV